MLQTNWLTEQLTTEYQNRLMEQANKARLAQEALKPQPTHRARRLIAKFRAELTDLSIPAQTYERSHNRH